MNRRAFEFDLHGEGVFRLGNREYCYPLTIADCRSRYLIACEGLSSIKSQFAFAAFECMHRTLKNETTKSAAFNYLQQQERFDELIEDYNNERPHQALAGRYPGQAYTPSVRIYEPAKEPEHPDHDKAIRVTQCGRICIGRRKINLSRSFANQIVGIREVADKIWLVSVMEHDPGFFDQDEGRVEPTANPFIPVTEKL